MKEIGNFFARLSSRKFLLTVGGIVAVTLYPEGATAICTLIATFTAAEGAADAVSRYSIEKTKQATTVAEQHHFADDDEEDLDLSVINPGNTVTPTTTTSPGMYGGDAPL